MLTDKELAEISEKMGEAVHNAWMEKRRKEKGWHAPEECPIMKKFTKSGTLPITVQIARGLGDEKYCENCHPCMRPYKDLPDGEKELDRQYPSLFLKILDELGYHIILKGHGKIAIPMADPKHMKDFKISGPSDVQIDDEYE